jgi:hypothetical protein
VDVDEDRFHSFFSVALSSSRPFFGQLGGERGFEKKWLLVISVFGFIAPNGLFIRWMVGKYRGLGPIWSDHLALAFIADAFIAMVLLAYWYARHPIGQVRWY